jgi:hypothetical protein
LVGWAKTKNTRDDEPTICINQDENIDNEVYYVSIEFPNHLILLGWGGFSVNRKKTDVFWKPKYSMLLWRKNGGETKKNRYFTKIEPYLYEFVANESSFGIYTQKLKRLCLKFDNVFNIPYV